MLSSCLLALAIGAPARAAGPPLGPDGETAEVSSLSAAKRLRVDIPQPGIDQDGNGVDDVVVAEVLLPEGSSAANRVPAIIDPSPYYSTLCRGNEPQCIGDTDGDHRNDKWPLFLDNYFVPRGYAVILAESNGTGHSTGCSLHGGPGDVAGMKSVIDWLNGRAAGYDDATGVQLTADWHNGKAAMIGKSYDGTLANAVAATGVQGLTTIVPESAISDWYDYSRMGGIRFNTHYPATLSSAVTNDGNPPSTEFPNRLSVCAPARAAMSATGDGGDNDATGDLNPFWTARDYAKDVGNVHAAVLAVHGLQDDNVRMNHLAQWWAGLKADGVPRKLWLTRLGHVDPFDADRARWVDTLHRWFDYWLYGVDNGIMREPAVTIEDAPNVWNDYADWPVPGTQDVDAFLQGTTPTEAGRLGLSSGGTTDALSWRDPTSGLTSEGTYITTPEGQQGNRRVFISPPLTHDLRISGTPIVDIQASLDQAQTNLGAILVDYGSGTQIARNEGIANTTTSTCWGQDSSFPGDFSSCYLEVRQVTSTVSQWRVASGILDSSNRDSLTTAVPATIGQQYGFRWPLMPQDYVFAAGHRIGLVLVATYTSPGVAGTRGTTITMDTRRSKLTLPIVGGYDAAAASGAFVPENVPPQLHGMPADVTTTTASRDGTAVSYASPTATDDRDPHPAVACDPASGATFAIGTTTVTCTATDASGNTASRSFTVRVDYDGPPPAPEPVAEQPPEPVAPPAEPVPGVNVPVVAAPARFTISRLRISRTGVVTFDAALPGRGSVSARSLASGKRLGAATVRRTRAGLVHVRIVPTRAGRARFRAHPRRAVRLTATYRPLVGRSSTLTGVLRLAKAKHRSAPRAAGGLLIPR